MAITLGNTKLRHGLVLAPMAGVTDGAYRALCRSMGAEMTVTEMVSAKAVCYKDKKTKLLARISPKEAPCALQLFGSEPEILAYAAAALWQESEEAAKNGAECAAPCAIDLNMGCPVPKIVNNGEGSALLQSPARIREITAAVKAAVSLPVSVKLRIGFTEQTANIEETVCAAVEGGADLITIHGRTRSQMYRPGIDYAAIRRGVEAAKGAVPVLGNGDIFCAADARRMLLETGCNGLMLARGTRGNPFLFAEVLAMLENRPYSPPSPRQRLQTALCQVEAMAAEHGELPAVLRARKLLCWYSAGLCGSASARRRINEAQSLADVRALIEALMAQQPS